MLINLNGIMVYYADPKTAGLISAGSIGDGYSIRIKWHPAYTSSSNMKICYHIYMATSKESVFSEGVKFIYFGNNNFVDIIDLEPGQLYFFAVRAVEYDENLTDISTLNEIYNGLKVYPESVLVSDVTDTDLVFNLLDVSSFPSYGVVRVGAELVYYYSTDTLNNSIVIPASTPSLGRGMYGTEPRLHRKDGYDGHFHRSPFVSLFLGPEEDNTNISMALNNFSYFDYSFTPTDGYHQIGKDLLTTDLTASDEFNSNNPHYDYAGWHRTSPVDLLTGVCVGSYIGGQMHYTDANGNPIGPVRGMNLQQQSIQRQEVILNTIGEAVTLIKRRWTGITCTCFNPINESPDDRCPKCLGTRVIIGWEQFINKNRSDGKILVRISPFEDDLKRNEYGLDPELTIDCWTMTVPTIKDRDIIVRYDQDGNEEFRYEVLSVNRNKTIVGLQGAQKFRAQKIRKFDPNYQINVATSGNLLSGKVLLSIESSEGVPPHTHQVLIPEGVTDLSKINQITSFNMGHSHVVRVENGSLVVREAVGHAHTILT